MPLVWASSLDQLPYCILNDVVHNVGGSIIDPTGFLHLRLFFDLCLMSCCESDNLPQKLLVHLTENISRKN